MGDNRLAAALLRQSSRALAAATVARLERTGPEVLQALPPAFANPRADLEVRILQLAEAVAVAAPELYADAADWYRVAFAHRGVRDDYLHASFAALQQVCDEELPAAARGALALHFAAALTVAAAPPRELECRLAGALPHVDRTRRFLLATLEGRADDALAEIRSALDAGVPIAELHDHVLLEAQREMGRMWITTEAPIADEHHTSTVVGRALELLHERIARPPAGAPEVLAFAVGGNLHDLGIRVVAQRLQVAGFAVTNLGGNMPASDLAFAMADRRVALLAVSVAMLLHLGEAAELVAARNGRPGARPPILFGGRPFEVVPDLHLRLGGEAAVTSAGAASAAAARLLRR
jgi:methanogenic corrinoid protein MtbC1